MKMTKENTLPNLKQVSYMLVQRIIYLRTSFYERPPSSSFNSNWTNNEM